MKMKLFRRLSEAKSALDETAEGVARLEHLRPNTKETVALS
jgi:hypothetical protein